MSGKFFQGTTFVFSNTLDDAPLEKLVVKHGGLVRKKLSNAVRFFVQSYHDDDDDRLSEAKAFGVQVVSPRYVRDCVKAGTILDFHQHALGENPGRYFQLSPTAREQLFPAIPEHAREEDELPQTWHEFEEMNRAKLTPDKRKIYLVELEAENTTPLHVQTLRDFTEAFFQMTTEVLPPLPFIESKRGAWKLPNGEKVAVIRGGAFPRVEAMDIVGALEGYIPEDGFCLIGITQHDLYEGDGEDVIMGRATGDCSCVVSLKQFDPHLESVAQAYTQSETSKWLEGVVGTLAHEASHMFGIDHCVFYSCLMNACVGDAATRQPDDVDPIDFCPIDLRKLHTAINFDPVIRGQALEAFYRAHGLGHHATWTAQRNRAGE